MLPEITDNCHNNYIELLSEFECIDGFTGDFYGNGTFLGGSVSAPFNFVRKCHIEGRIRKTPKEIKATVSINGRIQRTETTPKWLLVGDVPFPVWKMEEIENMMLTDHFFVNGQELKPNGGAAFTQFGKPITKVYVYKLEMQLNERFTWQTFGCTPVCDAQDYYYPINF